MVNSTASIIIKPTPLSTAATPSSSVPGFASLTALGLSSATSS
jgi:hypothetical protein